MSPKYKSNLANIILFSLVFGSITGCASKDSALAHMEESISVTQGVQEYVKAQKEIQHRENEEYISNTPSWALNPITSDTTGIYAVGIADSENMSVAMKKAKIEAEYIIAQKFKSELSGSERRFVDDSGESLNEDRYIGLIYKLVDQVNVSGIEVVKTAIVSNEHSGLFTSYMLLKMPYSEANRILQQQKPADADSDMLYYFDELQDRIDSVSSGESYDVSDL